MTRILALALSLLCSPAWAATYYVSNSGSDSANGTSTGTPFLTIDHATGLVNAGDIINVRAGTYNERLIIGRPGNSSNRIILRGYQNERPIIRSTGAGPTIYFYTQACEDVVSAGQSGNTDCTQMYWTVQGLEVRGSATGGGDGNAIKIDTPRVRLVGNKLGYSVADVVKVVRTANDTEILDNEILQNSAITVPSDNAQGIDMVGTDRVIVRGNYIHDVPDVGMYAKGNARNTVFENNLLVSIGGVDNGHAIMCGQETDQDLLLDGNYETYDCRIRNNVVVGSTWACIAVSSSTGAVVSNNSCYNTGTVQHGSIFLSNESIVGQASGTVEISNNIISGNSARPVIKTDAGAFTTLTTLTIKDNIYWTPTGLAPTFVLSGGSAVSFAGWQSAYNAASGKTDNSRVINPRFRSVVAGWNALALANDSPAINTGTVVSGTTRDFRYSLRGASPDVGAWEFVGTIANDSTAPTITSTSPAEGATFVAVTTTLTANFSEAINCATVTTSSFTVSGGVTGSVSCTDYAAIFTPSASLAYSTSYTATLSTAVLDSAGNPLGGVRSWTFTTGTAPSGGDTFEFLVYGDSRAGNTCTGNTVHTGLVAQMVAETAAAFVVHVGDMIAGLYNTTNWTNPGGCPGTGSSAGALSAQIAPLKSKTPSAGMSNFFIPVIGNHDAGWGSGWYPDPYGQGVCSVFDIAGMGVQNHTTKSYFLDKVRVPTYTDGQFYTLACSTTDSAVYDTFMYYTFQYKNTQIVVMRLNDDNHNIMECNTCDGALDNYDHYYNKHQLDWLNYVLAAAQANSSVTNIMVFTHAPLVTRSEHSANASWPTLLYTFSNYAKVKAVISGHNHVYERSYPVYATPGTPAGVRNDTTGVVYYTTGGGGSPLASLPRTEPLIAVADGTQYHYMKFSISGGTITSQAINTSGAVIDTFTR